MQTSQYHKQFRLSNNLDWVRCNLAHLASYITFMA